MKSIVARLAGTIVVAAIGAVALGAQKGPGPLSTDENWCRTLAPGPQGMAFCVSDDGNLTSFTSPGPVEQISSSDREGYVICSGTTNYWNSGPSDSGNWDPAVVTLAPKKVTVTRDTADGEFSLTLVFLGDLANRQVKLTTTVTKNVTGSTFNSVRYSRYVDYDVDGASVNFWDAASHGTWARETSGMLFSATSRNRGHIAIVEDFASNVTTEGSCDGVAEAIPDEGDNVARITYGLGRMIDGAARTAVLVYREY